MKSEKKAVFTQKSGIAAPAIPKKIKSPFLYYYLALIAFVFVIYGNSIQNKYSLDDHFVTYTNTQIQQGIKAIPAIFTTLYSETERVQFGYRPLVKLTYAFEYQFFGANPHISHFFNVLLYGLCCIILFKLLIRFFKKINIVLPFVITLIFIAHPIHTEVVDSLKNRDELLSLFFSLMAIKYSFDFFDKKNNKKYIVYTLLMLLLAMLSKASAIVFLGLIPLSLYYFSTANLKKIALFTLSILGFVLFFYFAFRKLIPTGHRPVLFWENPLFSEPDFLVKIATGILSLGYYIKLLILPYPLRFYYGYNQIPIVGWDNIWVLISLLFYLGIFIYALINLRKKSILSFGIFFFLVSISLYSNILAPIMGIIGERFLLVPSLGFSIVLGYLLLLISKVDLLNITKKITINQSLIISVFSLLVIYSVVTINRNSKWKNHLTLFFNDIENLDQSAKAHYILASNLMSEAYVINDNRKIKEYVDLAIKHYLYSIDIYSNSSEAWNNIGTLYATFYQDYEKALPYFKKASILSPDYEVAFANTGYAYEMVGKSDSAIFYYKAALKIKPSYTTAISYLSNFEFNKGRIKSAFELNKIIMQIEPASDVPFINIGKYYLELQDTATAIIWLEKAIEKVPDNPNLCQNIGNYYRSRGNSEKANHYQNLATSSKRKKQNK